MVIFGLKVALIGFGIVFCALVFLIFVIYAISYGAKYVDSKFVKEKPKAAKSVKAGNDAAAKQKDDNETIAVITAAIAAYSSNPVNIKAISRV